MICNPDILTDIHEVDHGICITSNVEQKVVKHKDFLGIYGDYVWYGKFRVANILNLSNLCKIFRITFDSKHMEFSVLFPVGNVKFQNIPRGRFYYDTEAK